MHCPRCQAENRDDSKFCGECGARLGPGPDAGSGGASLTTPLDAPPLALSPGTLVAGKYKVLAEIGHGGMGVVYKAEDLTLKRYVALKFLPPHLEDAPEFQERIAIEAQAAAALSHPNVCVIHEVGESNGQPYIAMEFVEGETLRDRVRRGPLDPGEAVGLIDQVAAGCLGARTAQEPQDATDLWVRATVLPPGHGGHSVAPGDGRARRSGLAVRQNTAALALR